MIRSKICLILIASAITGSALAAGPSTGPSLPTLARQNYYVNFSLDGKATVSTDYATMMRFDSVTSNVFSSVSPTGVQTTFLTFNLVGPEGTAKYVISKVQGPANLVPNPTFDLLVRAEEIKRVEYIALSCAGQPPLPGGDSSVIFSSPLEMPQLPGLCYLLAVRRR